MYDFMRDGTGRITALFIYQEDGTSHIIQLWMMKGRLYNSLRLPQEVKTLADVARDEMIDQGLIQD